MVRYSFPVAMVGWWLRRVSHSGKDSGPRVRGLSPISEFRNWCAEFDGALWDRQIEQDVAAGRLDSLAEEACRIFARAARRIGETPRQPKVLALLSPASEGDPASGDESYNLLRQDPRHPSLHFKKPSHISRR